MNFLLVCLVVLAIAGSVLAARPTAPAQSECVAHAARERRLNSTLNLIPNCNPDGSYQSLQCFGEAVRGGRFCSCWDRDGQPITSPSRKTKACECTRQRKAAQGRNGQAPPGTYVPQCEEDGTFKKKQVHGSTGQSWCVEPQTGTATRPKAPPTENIAC